MRALVVGRGVLGVGDRAGEGDVALARDGAGGDAGGQDAALGVALVDGEGEGLALERVAAGELLGRALERQLAGGLVGVHEVQLGRVGGLDHVQRAVALVGDGDGDGVGGGVLLGDALHGVGGLGDLVGEGRGLLALGDVGELVGDGREGVAGGGALGGLDREGRDHLGALLVSVGVGRDLRGHRGGGGVVAGRLDLDGGGVAGLELAAGDRLGAGEGGLAGGVVVVGKLGNRNLFARSTSNNGDCHGTTLRRSQRCLTSSASNLLNSVFTCVKILNKLAARLTVIDSKRHGLDGFASSSLTLVYFEFVGTVRKVLERTSRGFAGHRYVLGNLKRALLFLSL